VPETFKPAAEAQKTQLAKVPLQPPDRLEGRFTAAERLPGGWYQQGNDSMVSMGGRGLPSNGPGRMHLHPRNSFESNFSAQTSINSIYMPRRVESLMGEEDRKKYAMAQADQRAASPGTYMTGPPTGQVYEIDEAELRKGGWKDSVESLAEYQERPDYRRVDSSPGGYPEAGSPPDAALTIPRPASTVQNQRSGRRPLRRVSLVRTAAREGIELEDQRRRSPEQSPREFSRKSGQPGS
jgi:chitin synthase